LYDAVLDVLPFGLVVEEMTGAPLLINRRARALFLNDGSLLDRALSDALERLREAKSHIEAVCAADGTAYEIISRIVETGDELYRALIIADLGPERALSEGHVAVVDELVHALRGPLTLMLGYLELAAESPDEAGAFIPQSLGAAHAMEGKAATMLALLTGSIHGDGDVVVDAHGVREIVDTVCKAFGAANEIDSVVTPTMPPVAASAGELRVVMTTLIGTVIGFAESGAHIDVTVVDEPSYVRFTVETMRAFVTNEQRRLAMRSYQRLRRQGTFGSGLGLGLARESMLRCGGTLSVEGEGDVGFRISARFPRHQG
jgi:signal transduction histidine kinase